eukprot:gene12960-biopygen4983
MVRVGAGSSPAFQRLSRDTSFFILSACFTLSAFFTGGRKRPGNAGLRAAIRTAARTRSGRANETDGLWEESAFGWQVGTSTLRTERERDSEQVDHIQGL